VSISSRFSISTIPNSGSHCDNWASIDYFADLILFATGSQWQDRAFNTSYIEKYPSTSFIRIFSARAKMRRSLTMADMTKWGFLDPMMKEPGGMKVRDASYTSSWGTNAKEGIP
jgi:hypothetical protein